MLQSVPFGSLPLESPGQSYRSPRRTETIENTGLRYFSSPTSYPLVSRHNAALYNTAMFSETKPDSMDLSTYFPFLTLPLTQGSKGSQAFTLQNFVRILFSTLL